MALADILAPIRSQHGVDASEATIAEALIGSEALMLEVDHELKAAGVQATSAFVEADWWSAEIKHDGRDYMIVPAGLGDWPFGWYLIPAEPTHGGGTEYPEFDTTTLRPDRSLAPLLTEPAEVARLVVERLAS